ncbi:MAG TPA: nuclear transport factor 2 family protein [Terriglobia bacterium]|nr:nuclear transport factor 2 family protein [Terriglobia bacterium]
MPSAVEGNDREQIRNFLSRMNEAWLKGYTERLNESFHDDVVVKGPDLQEMGRGREACVKSYTDFIRLATVREFKASEPVIDLFDNMAVAIYPWEIRYRMNNQDHSESGHELLVLTRQKGKWQVAWRMVLSSALR